MTNVSPPCGICEFIRNLTDETVKERLVADLTPGGYTHVELVSRLQREYGMAFGATTIGRHRRETPKIQQANSDFVKTVNETASPSEPTVKVPVGWEPYSQFTESIGEAVVRLPTPGATARDLLIQAGFDPSSWQISGSINTRKWMRYDQQWLYYYKFDVVAGESPEVVEEHVDSLVELIRDRPKAELLPVLSGDDAFVFAVSDWQIGKREGADGTPETIRRVMDSIDMAVDRVRELRAQGRAMPTLLFASTGDLVEGTCGFYAGQQFLIDRNRRDQGRITRELITRGLTQLTPLFEKTIVAAAGGNHGENRSLEGKRLTSDGDNDDCAHYDAVKEAFDRAGQTDIDWRIMEDELSMSVVAGGVHIGLTHGHLFQKGSTPQQKAYEWWKGQDFGFHAVRGTRILLSSHFHHFSAIVHGSRTHLQTPAMDPGSKWYRESTGEDSPPGTLTFRLDGLTRLGWDDLSILSPR